MFLPRWGGKGMASKDHRLYSYMSEPLRIVGMTVDEIALGASGVLLFFAFESLMIKLTFALLTPVSVYAVKKVKKASEGFSLASFLHWRLGMRFGLSSFTPVSWKRRFFG